MQDLLTKKFWKEVKKIFQEARDGTAVKAAYPAPPAARGPGDASSAVAPTPPKDLNNAAHIEELPHKRASEAP